MDTGEKINILSMPNKFGKEIFENQIPNIFLTCRQLAEMLGVSEHTVRKWRKFKTIPYRKFGRSVRFQFEDVLKALEERNLR